jgi:hypothetical protein
VKTTRGSAWDHRQIPSLLEGRRASPTLILAANSSRWDGVVLPDAKQAGKWAPLCGFDTLPVSPPGPILNLPPVSTLRMSQEVLAGRGRGRVGRRLGRRRRVELHDGVALVAQTGVIAFVARRAATETLLQRCPSYDKVQSPRQRGAVKLSRRKKKKRKEGLPCISVAARSS